MLKLTWGCDNFLLPAPQNEITKPGFIKNSGASDPKVPEPISVLYPQTEKLTS